MSTPPPVRGQGPSKIQGNVQIVLTIEINVKSFTGEPVVDTSLVGNSGGQFTNGIVGFCFKITDNRDNGLYFFTRPLEIKRAGKTITLKIERDRYMELNFASEAEAKDFADELKKLPTKKQKAQFDRFLEDYKRRHVSESTPQ